jgi:rubrerythrin
MDMGPTGTTAVSGRSTRGRLLRRLVLLGGAGAAAALLERLPPSATSAPSAAQDARVLDYALLLEELQAAFYAQALAEARLTGALRTYAEIVVEHERRHVAFLRDALGRGARAKPRFDFGATTRDEAAFARTAVTLEDIAVAAYNGQAANVTPSTLAAALRIVSVEARHAAWIRDLAGMSPAPRAADPGKDARTVTDVLEAARFL